MRPLIRLVLVGLGYFSFAEVLIAQSSSDTNSNSSEVEQIEIDPTEDAGEEPQQDDAAENAEDEPEVEEDEGPAVVELDCAQTLQLTTLSLDEEDCASNNERILADPIPQETQEILLREDGAYINVTNPRSADREDIKSADPNSSGSVQTGEIE